MIIETKPQGADEASEARSILLTHTEGDYGMCAGCYEFVCAFAPFPCTQVRWARAVLSGGEPS